MLCLLLQRYVTLLPSLPTRFANGWEVVESVLVVNPGFLSKRRGPGFFAKLTVLPRSVTEEERSAPVLAHKLYERVRVDITRI